VIQAMVPYMNEVIQVIRHQLHDLTFASVYLVTNYLPS